MSKDIVWVDIETTGLDPQVHQIVEIAWGIDSEWWTLIPPHNLWMADPKALEINRYHERMLDKAEHADETAIAKFYQDLLGKTMAGANPAFDAKFLEVFLGAAPWKHRLLDVEAYVAGVFGWDEPRGLKATREHLESLGYSIAEPNHSAVEDMICAQECYLVAQSEALLRAQGTP
jgi:DNA polymerase III epsilon subunit-like protein